MPKVVGVLHYLKVVILEDEERPERRLKIINYTHCSMKIAAKQNKSW